jgi:hypothetical protein
LLLHPPAHASIRDRAGRLRAAIAGAAALAAAASRHAEVMRVRKLLVPTLMATTLAAPVAVAAVGPTPPSSIAEPDGRSADAKRAEREAIRREARHTRRTAIRRARRKAAPEAPKVAVPPHLEAIALCESGGDPRAIGGGGAYRGKYQFSYATWAAVGGSGDPAAAPEAEQDMRAAMLYARSGPGQWPVCGR